MTDSQKHRVMDIRNGSRKGQKKVRTGCKTCKARRVKCDEATPVCGRCTKSGRVCVGKLPKVSESKIISILPRPHQRIESTSLGTYQPSMTLSLNVDESCYIQFFHHEATLGLFGLFNADFWTADLMQQCYTTPAIRHAIVAVGALVRSQETDCKQVGAAARCHQKFALRQYSKAISLLRETLATETGPESCLRTATTSCILFVCFEIFYGNKAQALQQLYYAATLITSYCSILWHSTPKPGSVDESKYIQVFRRFLNKAKLWDVIFRRYDCRWLPHALTRREHEQEILLSMPVAFGDIKEASHYYDLYTQYLASSILYYYQSQDHNKETPIDHFLGDQLRQSAFNIGDKLKVAIEPLLLQAMLSSESNPDFFILTKIIFWRQRLYRIILELEFGRSEMWFDTVTPMIEEALEITLTLKEIFEKPTANLSTWKSTKSGVGFKFGTWLTYTLFSIAMKCRVGRIRENVISWLSSLPSGGLGDCSAAGKVALAISELEGKADGDDGVIPREKRVTVKMVMLNDAKSTADVIYLTHEGIEKSLDVKL